MSYHGDSLVIRSLAGGKPEFKRLAVSDKQHADLQVRFESPSLPPFSLRLKPKIDIEPAVFPPAEKMLVLSDIEGEFAVLRSLLIDGGVMDSRYNWTFGTGHLVVAGDLFDRGKQVTQVLWLLYRLEQLARSSGGYVHVLLGNHDIMNLSGDLRYVDARYHAVSKALSADYKALYRRDTELGRWLRSKNVIEKIGEVLFVHGGISAELNQTGMDLPQINAACRQYYDAARQAIPQSQALYFGKDGPLWYRGYFFAPKASMQTVDQTLQNFGVKTIVAGHSISEGNVGFYYAGKVLGVDVDAHRNIRQAAYFLRGNWYKLDQGKIQPLPSHADWITIQGPEGRLPVVFREFELPQGKRLKRATLSITALGLYQATLNGKKVGADYFSPGWTSYHNRLQYQQYDLKGMLHPGKNKLEVLLARGWYSGAFGAGKTANHYGKEQALNCKLLLEFSDGSFQQLISDTSWTAGPSQILRSDFYDGEAQDTRVLSVQQIKMPEPDTLKGQYRLSQTPQVSKAMLVAASAPPVRTQQVFGVVNSWKDAGGGLMLDFGQNLAGFVRIRVRGRKGDTLQVSHAELLDKDSGLYTGNLRLAKATDQYLLSGEEQVLEPHFTYHGFRYARISGVAASRLKPKDIQAVALYSDLKPAGSFQCANPVLNQLQHNILWSMRSNFVDVPTDCPQRSERFGWTGDAQVFFGTAAWNYDVLDFYRKYLRDLAADQGSNGGVPNIVPDFPRPQKGEKGGVAGWGDAAILIPWRLYQIYGDKDILEDQYQSMKAWVDYVRSKARGGLWKDDGYGDWYAQGDSTSIPFIDQCYYAYCSRLLSQSAELIGLKQEASTYKQISGDATAAFLDNYGQFNTPSTSTQTAYLLALAFDLLPEGRRQEIAARLVRRIHQDGLRLTTGFLGTPHLLPVLSRFGYQDLAYQLLLRKEFPSWLYPITKGATTIWEKWDAVKADGTLQACSFNHFAYGAVGEWFYSDILGIKALEPGFKKIKIQPAITPDLPWASGSYHSVSGEISVRWKLLGQRNNRRSIILQTEIPRGVTAEVILPGNSRAIPIGPGRHRISGMLTSPD